MSHDLQSQSLEDSKSVTELFHRVIRVIPHAQTLTTVEPETLVTDALDLHGEHGFSQLPVVFGREVLFRVPAYKTRFAGGQ